MKINYRSLILTILYSVFLFFSVKFSWEDRFSSLHIAVVFLISLCFIQGAFLTRYKSNNSVYLRYVFLLFALMFIWLMYLLQSSLYLGYYLSIVFLVFILVNWHYILDKRLHETNKISIWISVFLFAIVGFYISNFLEFIRDIFILLSIFSLAIFPLIYYIKNRKRIQDYMAYQKNIIILVIASFIVGFFVYLNFYQWRNLRGLPIFMIVVSIHFFIQNIFVLGVIKGFDKRYLLIGLQLVLIYTFILNFSIFLTTLVAIVPGFFIMLNVLGILRFAEDDVEKLYQARIDQLMNEAEFNREIADYFHDDILQDIIFLKRESEAGNINSGDLTDKLDGLILNIRNNIENLSPIVSNSISLKDNIWTVIEKVGDRYAGSNVLVDLYCKDDLFLDSPYDVLSIKIVKELINNIYKHTNSDFADLNIDIKENNIVISCHNDDGYFDIKKFYESKRFSGLKQIERNVKLLGGDLIIQNMDGVKISITIPLDRRVIIENSISR